MKFEPSIVPCDGCVSCCKGPNRMPLKVMPEEGDNPLDYICEHDKNTGHLVISNKENGDCAHLTPEGCSVHEKKPHVCKIFDCRKLYQMPGAVIRQLEKLHPKTMARGRALLQNGKEK